MLVWRRSHTWCFRSLQIKVFSLAARSRLGINENPQKNMIVLITFSG